jgi:hypothetical protein
MTLETELRPVLDEPDVILIRVKYSQSGVWQNPLHRPLPFTGQLSTPTQCSERLDLLLDLLLDHDNDPTRDM